MVDLVSVLLELFDDIVDDGFELAPPDEEVGTFFAQVLLQVVNSFRDESGKKNREHERKSFERPEVSSKEEERGGGDLNSICRSHFARNDDVRQNPHTRVLAGGPSRL